MRKVGAIVVGALLCAACGGGEEAQKPAVAPPPPEPVASAPAPAPTQAAAPAPAKPTQAEMWAAALKNVADTQNAHDSKKFAALYTPDAVLTVAGMPMTFNNSNDIGAYEQQFFDGFKDVKFWFSRVWIHGDMAACEWGWSGTNTGDFMGMKATEKPAGGMGLSVVWINGDGLVKKENRYFDMTSTMTQLGHGKGKAAPVPTPAATTETHTAKGDEDKNLDLVKTMSAAWDSKKDADFVQNLDDACVYHELGNPEPHKGKADAKKFFNMAIKAIPDAKSTAGAQFAVEDFIINEHTLSGTQKGQFGPFPGSNKPVALHGVDVIQVKNGKFVEAWGFMNSAELPFETGAMKMPGAAPAGAAKADAKADAKGGAAPKATDKGADKGGDKGAAKPAAPATPAATPAPKK